MFGEKNKRAKHVLFKPSFQLSCKQHLKALGRAPQGALAFRFYLLIYIYPLLYL